MARILFFTILAMCLVCMLQAGVVPDPTPEPNPLHDLETAVKSTLKSINDGVQTLINDPSVQKVFQGGAELVAQGAEALRQGAEKFIPKTQ